MGTKQSARAVVAGRPIGVGVLGYGYWGPNLVRNFNAHADARVVAVCDAQESRAKRAGSTYPGIAVTTNFDDLLTNPAIDVVACATPVSTHYALGKAALEAGKHVLLEKPMASTAAECHELIELAAERGLRIFVDHTFVFTPAVQKMKQMLASGDLGALYYYDSTRINLGIYQSDVDVVWDLAPHDISIIDFLLDGRLPASVACTGVTRFGRHADQAYLTLTYDDRFLAHVHANWLAPVKVRQVLLGCEKRMLVYDEATNTEKLRVYDRGVNARTPEDPYQHMISYREGDMWAPRLESREALAVEVNNIVETLRGNAEPMVDGALGLRVVRMLELLTRSLEAGGAPVAIAARDFVPEPVAS